MQGFLGSPGGPDVLPLPVAVGVHLLGRGELAHDVIVRHFGEQARLIELPYQPCGHHRRDEVDEFAAVHRVVRMDPGVVEVGDMLVVTEALLDEPPFVIHPVDDQGVGVQIGFKDDGAEPLVALLHVLRIERLALVVLEVVGLFLCRPPAVIERVQPIAGDLLLLEQHVQVVVVKHPIKGIHAMCGDPLVVALDRAEPV